MAAARDEWQGSNGAVGTALADLNEKCLAAYAANPALIEEHANAERIQTEGGYGRRQVWELIQNGADELIETSGRVEVVLTDTHLYCANEGKPVTPQGAGAILSAYRSSKRGPEIGRFGLGFKSVLGVSAHPEFFSRSGSFGFDPDFARKEILGATSARGDDVPTLRLAIPLDAGAARKKDKLLGQLMQWATTVVRLPLDRETGEWLAADLGEFPSEFLVFSPHISLLVLDDQTSAKRREITLVKSEQESEHVLIEGGREDRWRVFSEDFKPSARAARDGGAMAKREVIRFQWAVPTKAQQRVGRLWAYFPTLEETTLSGVINAPWKLNDDRTRVIEGPFNREIVEHASKLALSVLDVLTDPEDPGNVLDILPARGRETRNWADRDLTELINSDAPVYPSIPDQTGELELPMSLSLHPDALPREAVQAWSVVPGRPTTWAHPTVDANQARRARTEKFMEAANRRAASIEDWLEAAMPRPSLEASAHLLVAAALLVRGKPDAIGPARQARILLDADEKLTTCESVFLPGSHEVSLQDLRLVHPALAKIDKVGAALRILGVQAVDPALELDAYLSRNGRPGTDEEWETLWGLAGRVDADRGRDILVDHLLAPENVMVRMVSGRWVRLAGALLPGDIATASDAPDNVLDIEWHASQIDLLRRLGAVAAPSTGAGSLDEPLLREFHRKAVDQLLASLGAARPNRDLISVQERSIAGPVTPIQSLEGPACARFTHALLRAQTDFEPWVVEHSSYPPIRVEHPIIEIVKQHGLAETRLGLVSVPDWVGPRLERWSDLLPVVEVPPSAAQQLALPETLEELSEQHWESALGRIIALEDPQMAAEFYPPACLVHHEPPATAICRVGDEVETRPPDEIRLVTTRKHEEVLSKSGLPVLLVAPESVALLVKSWGMRDGADEISTEVVAIETTPRAALTDLFPALRVSLDDRARELSVARCSELLVETVAADGRLAEATQFHIADGVIYADESFDDAQLLREIGRGLGIELDEQRIDRIITNRLDQEVRRLQKALKAMKTDADRLAAVVDQGALVSSLPVALLNAVTEMRGEPDHVALARMAFAVHGVDTLKVFKDQFESAGLQPPATWAGSRAASDFVRRLGFAPANAGFEGGRRASRLEVEGRPDLKPLHEFQETVVREIQELVRGKKKDFRGLLSLPTGAGKTRVAIQALVEVMRDGDLSSPLLWVAQRDELCEQAVQAWSEVWRSEGPTEMLTISRLWSTNAAEPTDNGSQVVVATIDKLDSVHQRPEYEWLAHSSCVVIDEAHLATSPQYTRLLRWQDIGRGKRRAPLIGLTATPYRSNEADTKFLVGRFGVRLDFTAFDDEEPYSVLQEMGVLSRVDHEILEGSELNLSRDEMEAWVEKKVLPSSAAERLASNVDRNHHLVEHIANLDDEWTVLLFCTSVEHAHVMAGLLNEEGIPSNAISGKTAPAARRHFVEAFRRQEVRVLTNYGVFAAGFDAPQVRAVYVARPTHSPNVYQQMIGRGLRGPLNGGSEDCLIVNVVDNIINFGEALAFREFEHLWDPAQTP